MKGNDHIGDGIHPFFHWNHDDGFGRVTEKHSTNPHPSVIHRNPFHWHPLEAQLLKGIGHQLGHPWSMQDTNSLGPWYLPGQETNISHQTGFSRKIIIDFKSDGW